MARGGGRKKQNEEDEGRRRNEKEQRGQIKGWQMETPHACGWVHYGIVQGGATGSAGSAQSVCVFFFPSLVVVWERLQWGSSSLNGRQKRAQQRGGEKRKRGRRKNRAEGTCVCISVAAAARWRGRRRRQKTRSGEKSRLRKRKPAGAYADTVPSLYKGKQRRKERRMKTRTQTHTLSSPHRGRKEEQKCAAAALSSVDRLSFKFSAAVLL